MKRIKSILVAAIISASLPGYAADGISVAHMSQTNSLVKIDDASARYLIIPVEESVPDARIEVLVNGKLATVFFARLAANKVDYTVPFDLTPYTSQGNVSFNVILPDDRAFSRNTSDNLVWSELSLSNDFDDSNREKYRPLYHFTPKYGWMNDPNGMFYKDGVWNLYFQHNPYGSKWQNMTWGHATSTDLVHWQQHPNAIEPNGLGSVFSGSSVVDHNNTAGFGDDAVVAIYTSAGASQIQSLAFSTDDGMTFTNYNGNPIITTFGEARDPNMFWYEPTGRWILVLAHALDKEMLIYSSPDLKNWTLESAFGKGYGQQDGVWECPDLFPLPVKGTDKQKWVLICNINPGGPFGGSAAQYFIGDFDGHRFTPEEPAEVTKWMDWGKDHYAAVSFSDAPDGRRTSMAWMSNWEYANEVPTMQYRSASALPRDHELFIAPDGKTYLASVPAAEVEKMLGKRTHIGSKGISAKGLSFALPKSNDGICELDIDINSGDAREVVITLSNDAGEYVDMTIDTAAKTLTFDRSHSGLTNFSSHFAVPTAAPLLRNGKDTALRIFIDKCSVEVFEREGRFAMTNLVFPTKPYTTVSVKSVGGNARLKSADIHEINL